MTSPDARARAIAVARAYARGDMEGLHVLLDGVVPPVRDADVDPLGAVGDEARATPVAELVRELSLLVVFFAGRAEHSRQAADAALAALLAADGEGE